MDNMQTTILWGHIKLQAADPFLFLAEQGLRKGNAFGVLLLMSRGGYLSKRREGAAGLHFKSARALVCFSSLARV